MSDVNPETAAVKEHQAMLNNYSEQIIMLSITVHSCAVSVNTKNVNSLFTSVVEGLLIDKPDEPIDYIMVPPASASPLLLA